MLERTHVRIAEEVARMLKLKKSESDLLKLGSTRPDSFEEFPHHKGKEGLMLAKILDARALYLKGDDEAFVKLGEALHYVADKWTLRPRMANKHTEWEMEIDKCKIMDNAQFKRELTDAVTPAKTKDFYSKLLELIEELTVGNDFKRIVPRISKFVVEDVEGLEMEGKYREIEDVNEFIAILPYLCCLNRKGDYSTPWIDLNLAFRLSLVISRLALSQRGSIIFSKSALNWNNLPIDWREKIETYEEEARIKDVEKRGELKATEVRENIREKLEQEEQELKRDLKGLAVLFFLGILLGIFYAPLGVLFFFGTVCYLAFIVYKLEKSRKEERLKRTYQSPNKLGEVLSPSEEELEENEGIETYYDEEESG